jgi:hypothetical protein
MAIPFPSIVLPDIDRFPYSPDRRSLASLFLTIVSAARRDRFITAHENIQKVELSLVIFPLVHASDHRADAIQAFSFTAKGLWAFDRLGRICH